MSDDAQTVWYWLLYEHGNDNFIRQSTVTDYEPEADSFPSDVTYVEITQSLHESMPDHLRYKYNTDGTVTEVDHAGYMAKYQRGKRNRLLEETDAEAVGDRTISQAMRDYRQALRDLPDQDGWPDNVTFPTKP